MGDQTWAQRDIPYVLPLHYTSGSESRQIRIKLDARDDGSAEIRHRTGPIFGHSPFNRAHYERGIPSHELHIFRHHDELRRISFKLLLSNLSNLNILPSDL